MSNNKLSEKIKQARLESKLSQKDLGQAVHISEKAISSYEQGRTTPPIGMLKKIAVKTNKSITFFIEEPTTEVQVAALFEKIEDLLKEVKTLLKNHPDIK
jgi:transcriptional regulator with XRE-family HTH domain